MMWAQWRQGSVYVESLDALLNKGLAWLDQANRRNFDLDFGGRSQSTAGFPMKYRFQ